MLLPINMPARSSKSSGALSKSSAGGDGSRSTAVLLPINMLARSSKSSGALSSTLIAGFSLVVMIGSSTKRGLMAGSSATSSLSPHSISANGSRPNALPFRLLCFGSIISYPFYKLLVIFCAVAVGGVFVNGHTVAGCFSYFYISAYGVGHFFFEIPFEGV